MAQVSSTHFSARRFQQLWQRTLVSNATDRSAEIFATVAARYAESHRRYHTQAHIAHCLSCHDDAAELMHDADAVETTLWFHDVIYELGSRTNEADSVDFFLSHAADAFPDEFNQRVADMIMVTEHKQVPEPGDAQYVVDIDLSSFGLPWETFSRDCVHLREEAPAAMSDEDYRIARVAFLEGLVARPALFLTPPFKTRYEEIAQDNMARHLDQLRAGIGL
ncbi:MAG: hypothetical protein DRQ37_02205 [Gammaproteobacteria bacterium]|nr:MAG: hypothetical protein DRQ37_02205 [Gammaproteobacteria bacterium]